MTITIITDKNTYVFDNAEEAFIKETNLSIQQSDEEFGRGFIITEYEKHD